MDERTATHRFTLGRTFSDSLWIFVKEHLGSGCVKTLGAAPGRARRARIRRPPELPESNVSPNVRKRVFEDCY